MVVLRDEWIDKRGASGGQFYRRQKEYRCCRLSELTGTVEVCLMTTSLSSG
ncbi:hypothetical protein GCM10018954_066120 [Kutzneria kofuensis]